MTILDALTGAGADLVVGTIPAVTAIPYVTTLPWFIVDPSTGDPVLDEGGNPVPFIGPDGPLGSGDLVLLSAGTHLKQG